AEELRELASLTPAQLAAEIRSNAADVHAQAQAWRSSPEWNGDERDRTAYETVAGAISELDTIPEPTEYHDVQRLIHAVSPIFDLWWTDRPGTRPELVQAVERLRRTVMHRIGWAADARRLLGTETATTAGALDESDTGGDGSPVVPSEPKSNP